MSARTRQRAAKARGRGRRIQRPPLSRPERLKLRAAVLQKFGPDDDVNTMAARLNQPPQRIAEAIGRDVRLIGEYLGDKMKVDEIIELHPRWNLAFVDYARRRTFGRAHRSRNTIAYLEEPWNPFKDREAGGSLTATGLRTQLVELVRDLLG